MILQKENILFPIESIGRELDYKLLLASMFLTNSRQVLIGQHDYLFNISKYMDGGIYLGKNSFSIKSDGFWNDRHKAIKKQGITVIHLDEEGGIYWGNEDEWCKRLDKRIDISAIDSDDFICTWGEFQKKYYASFDNIPKNNIFVTGNPRFDLLKKNYRGYYKNEIDKIKKQYGDFILVPTAFSWFNNGQGHSDTFSERMGFEPFKDTAIKYIKTWAYSGKTYIEYIQMIINISLTFPDKNIVIRPHPAEDQEIYRKVFDNFDNVHVVLSGSSFPWILSAKLVIQDGSTTAIEAHLGGTPVINFMPVINKSYEMFLPSIVGIQCSTVAEVIKYIKALYNNKELEIKHPQNNKRAVSVFNSFINKEDSFKNVLSVLNNVSKSRDNRNDKFNKVFFCLFRIKYTVLNILKDMIRPFFSEKYKKYSAFRVAFPGFKKSEILGKMEQIEKLTGVKLDCKFVNENLILITKK